MDKQELFLRSPYLNAAGSLGFAPDFRDQKAAISGIKKLAVFITNPISLAPRQPAASRDCIPYDGGFLLHSGLPNPGLKAVLKQYAARWAVAPVPVVPHLVAAVPDELERMVRQIEGLENVMGIEIGLPAGIDPKLTVELVNRAAGELSVIASLPFEDALEMAEVLKDSPASALSLSAPRGILPAPDGKLLEGRLYGPAVFPSALKIVAELGRRDCIVFGAGGVYRQEDSAAMLAAGAKAVQLDAVLWGVGGVNILAGW